MTKTEATHILYRELEPLFKKRGYALKKSKWHGFKREEENGFTWFYFDFYSYGNKQELYFVANKKNNAVEDIYKKVAERFALTPPISDYTVTLFANYFTLPKERQTEIGYRVMVDNEADFVAVLRQAGKFFEEEVFEEMDRFTDLRHMDQMINGEDFWINDRDKLYSFGDGFYLRRIIIAHLCRNLIISSLLNFEYEGVRYVINSETDVQTLPENVPGLEETLYLVKLLKDVMPLY